MTDNRYTSRISHLLSDAYRDLHRKLEEAGRVAAPGEQVEMVYDLETNSFTLSIETIPDPVLVERFGTGPYWGES